MNGETLLTFEKARDYIQQYRQLDRNLVRDFLRNDVKAERIKGWKKLYSKESIDQYFFSMETSCEGGTE